MTTTRAGKLNIEQRKELIGRYADGESSVALAAELGVRPVAILYHVRKAGVRVRRWKLVEEKEQELVRRYMEGVPTSQLQADYVLSGTGVRDVLRRYDVAPSHSPQLLSDTQKKQVLALFQQGLAVRDICANVNCSNGAVSKILRRDFGVAKRPSTKRQLLSPEQRIEVVSRYKEYATYEELVKEFDCSPSVIKSALTEHGIEPRIGWAKYRTVEWTDRKGRNLRFKSSWEKAFAAQLDVEDADWNYEPRSYPLKICRRYTPDFEVLVSEKLARLVEVHGWMDQRTENRLAEFCKTYPELPFELLGPGELASAGVIAAHWTKHPQAVKVTKTASRLAEIRFQQKSL